jgi:hypothetical protein
MKATMDERFQAILDGLPPKPSPEQLEPFRELIREMRRSGRTCREIADTLAEKCHVQADLGAIYDLARVHNNGKPARNGMVQPPREAAPLLDRPPAARRRDKTGPRLRARQGGTPRSEELRPVFEYNAHEPLRLLHNSNDSE